MVPLSLLCQLGWRKMWTSVAALGPPRIPGQTTLGGEGPWRVRSPCHSPSGGHMAAASPASLWASPGTRTQGRAGPPTCRPPCSAACLPPGAPSVCASVGQALSVDGQADVGVLVVEQPGHSHRLVALAEHLLLDAGRPDVVDEILQ